MGQLILPVGSRVYLDTAPVIYSVEKNPEYWPLMQDLWSVAESGNVEIFTSELTLLETLVQPIRDKDPALVQAYEELLLGSDVRLVPISISVLREAVTLRATLNLKTPDAIHAATSILSGCDQLVSNDDSFRRLAHPTVSLLSDLI